MRLLCYVKGHQYRLLMERWIEPKDENDHLSLLRFMECSHCMQVLSTITHPDDYKSKWSVATKFDHRTLPPKTETEKS
jgi:hypothetical protein